MRGPLAHCWGTALLALQAFVDNADADWKRAAEQLTPFAAAAAKL